MDVDLLHETQLSGESPLQILLVWHGKCNQKPPEVIKKLYGSLLLTFCDESRDQLGEEMHSTESFIIELKWLLCYYLMNAKSLLLGRLCHCWQRMLASLYASEVWEMVHTVGLQFPISLLLLNFRKKHVQTMWTSNLNVAIERNWYKALCFLLFSECCGMHRLNTSEVSPCGEASSRWWSEPCALCVNAVVVWIVIAGLCVKLAQSRDRNSPPLTTHSHSYRADANFHVSITPHMQHNGKNN